MPHQLLAAARLDQGHVHSFPETMDALRTISAPTARRIGARSKAQRCGRRADAIGNVSVRKDHRSRSIHEIREYMAAVRVTPIDSLSGKYRTVVLPPRRGQVRQLVPIETVMNQGEMRHFVLFRREPRKLRLRARYRGASTARRRGRWASVGERGWLRQRPVQRLVVEVQIRARAHSGRRWRALRSQRWKKRRIS